MIIRLTTPLQHSDSDTPNPNKHHQTQAKGQMIHQAENIGQHKGQNP